MSADEQENQSSHKRKPPCNRHPPEIIAKLEEIFQRIRHPNEEQKREIGKEVGLEPKQVKFWFQNKKYFIKVQEERVVNNALHMENERVRKENMQMKEVLKNILCPTCRGLPRRNHAEQEHIMKQLRLENAYLKQEHERVSKIVASGKQKQSLEQGWLQVAPPTRSSYDLCAGSSSRGPSTLEENMLHQRMSNNNNNNRTTPREKAIMLRAGINAKDEVLKLLSTYEPLWVKSQGAHRLILNAGNYYKFFPRVDHFNGANARVESSKGSCIVRIKAPLLVDMLLDSEKWKNLFPTIVTKAETIEVLEMGSSRHRSGALLLMHGEMHVLSPLLRSREYYFLRYCEQIGPMWIIADVSYDYLKREAPHSHTWKFPSGCMIHQISSLTAQVSWVEHVEVEENIQTHYLYRDLVNSTIAFGAERWLMELQRMTERLTTAESQYIPVYDRGDVTSPQGRRSVMELSQRMVKSFSRVLTMSSQKNLLQHRIEDDNNGIKISIGKSEDPLSKDMNVVTVSSSFLLPFTSPALFNFFKDPRKRFQWDNLCDGETCIEAAHISTGTHPNNHISIFQPVEPLPQNGVVIMQDSFIDPLGSYIVYSPVNIQELKATINGHDSSTVLILPSGIVISEVNQSLSDAQTPSSSSRIGRSLLTVTLQIFMSGPIPMSHQSMTSVNSLMTSTVENIKNALLNSSDLV